MEIVVTGRHMDITPAIREYATEKVSKLPRYFDRIQSIEVIGRGLLVGHDGTFFGRDGADRRAWNVGRHGFFDISVPNGKTNALFIDQPVVGTCHGLVPTLTGTSQDDILIGRGLADK